MSNKFVSLHHHTTFSYMDGVGTPAQHVERAAELGYEALAATEHGNVSSHVQLEKAALKAGIKPIFGCELYTAPADMRETGNRRKWHLTVLAENDVGYRNLMRIVSRSWAEGFYQWPTASGAMLREHSDGLIVTSGCADSLLACDLLGGKGRELHEDEPDWEAAVRTINNFKSLFGDRYSLEVQAFPELRRTRILNPIYAELSARTGVPLVATCDVHYPHPDDNELQKILHAAGRGSGTVAAAEAEWEYDIRLTLPPNDSALLRKLEGTGLTRRQASAAVARSTELGQLATVTLPKAERLRYPVEPGQTGLELIWEWLREGWRYRWPTNASMRARKDEYNRRIAYEMELIQSKDFYDYFLMLSDAVRFAKDSGIPVGPARGSAAASLVCYLLRITEVDPMQFPTMVFERFIDVTREDLPDVDLDFADDRRDEIRQHLARRYGADHVGNIGNFTRYRGKNAVNDVARVYSIPKAQAEIVNGLVIERSGGDSRFDASLGDTKEMFPQAAEVFARYPALDYAIALEGNYRGFGVHAAGLVVANRPINEVAATYAKQVGADKRWVDVLSVDKYDAEYLNMLKVDVLGLTTMGVISTCLELIGMKLDDLYTIPLDDPITLAAFKRGDVGNIFQFEGRATRLVTKDVIPENFNELADINALARPGPLFSGATATYVEVKHGRQEPEHLHPIVDEITKWSQYQIIYQEQILRIVREVGGFPWTHASAIRKIISQKKGEAAFNTMQQDFIDGAYRLHGIDKALAVKIWKFLVTSGTYAFNVAHCVSYSMLAFWCQWLKQRYPAEFYTAHLRKIAGDKDGRDKWRRLIKDAHSFGRDVRVVGPSISTSGVTWTHLPARRNGSFTRPARVQAGFSQIPGIGDKMADRIIAARIERPDAFRSWDGLLTVSGIGPRKAEMALEFARSADPFGVERVGKILDRVRADATPGNDYGFMTPTRTSNEIPPDAHNLRVTWVGFVKARNYQDYVENQRSRTGEEVQDIIARMKERDKVTSCVLHAYDDGDEDVYLRFNRFIFPKFKRALEGLRIGHDLVIVQGLKKHGFGLALHVQKLQVLDPDAWSE